MNLGARMAAWSGSKLPYDAEVLYIYSNGDANVAWLSVPLPSLTLPMSLKFSFMAISKKAEWSRFFTSNSSSGNLTFRTSKNAGYNFCFEVWGSSHSTRSLSYVEYGKKLEFDATVSSTFVVNANIGTHSLTYTANGAPVGAKVINFWQGSATYTAENADFRMYGFELYYGDVCVRDLIPVRVGNVGYMYDRVSKTLFGNAGTGAFILGPDV